MLLEAARERGLRYVQVSTDEVYGSIEEGSFTEASPLQPVLALQRDQGRRRPARRKLRPHLRAGDASICRGSNDYGPYQYPEKLIPLMILNALHGDPLPVYGDGLQVRNWLYVEDFARGIGHVLEHGAPGEVYNVGGPDEAANLDVVQPHRRAHRRRRVADRARHRPARATTAATRSAREKVRALGWEAQVRFDEGLEHTVAWYRDNTWWWEPIRSGDYRAYYERQYGRALG